MRYTHGRFECLKCQVKSRVPCPVTLTSIQTDLKWDFAGLVIFPPSVNRSTFYLINPAVIFWRQSTFSVIHGQRNLGSVKPGLGRATWRKPQCPLPHGASLASFSAHGLLSRAGIHLFFWEHKIIKATKGGKLYIKRGRNIELESFLPGCPVHELHAVCLQGVPWSYSPEGGCHSPISQMGHGMDEAKIPDRGPTAEKQEELKAGVICVWARSWGVRAGPEKWPPEVSDDLTL